MFSATSHKSHQLATVIEMAHFYIASFREQYLQSFLKTLTSAWDKQVHFIGYCIAFVQGKIEQSWFGYFCPAK
jgi:hypothetical protein